MSGVIILTTAANAQSLVHYFNNPSFGKLGSPARERVQQTIADLTRGIAEHHGSDQISVELTDEVSGAQVRLIHDGLIDLFWQFDQLSKDILWIEPLDANIILGYMAPADGSIRLGIEHVDDDVVDEIIAQLRAIVSQEHPPMFLNAMFSSMLPMAELYQVIRSIQGSWYALDKTLAQFL
jgi:hypothetical protein